MSVICLGAVFDPSSDSIEISIVRPPFASGSIEISIVRPPFAVVMSFSTHALSLFLRRLNISPLIQTLTLLFVTGAAVNQ